MIASESSYAPETEAKPVPAAEKERTKWFQRVEDSVTGLHSDAREALIQLKGRVIEPFMPFLRQTYGGTLWKEALSRNVHKDKRVLTACIEKLKDPDARVRVRAAITLGLIKDQRTLHSLSIPFRNDIPEVRSWVAIAMGLLRHDWAVDILTGALKDRDEVVRLRCVMALGNIKSTRAVPALLIVLKEDKSPMVRKWAAKVLGFIKDDSSLHALTLALQDKDPEVQFNAFSAIACFPPRKVLPTMKEACYHQNPNIQRCANTLVGFMSGKTASRNEEPTVPLSGVSMF